jgi:hypothetical protein
VSALPLFNVVLEVVGREVRMRDMKGIQTKGEIKLFAIDMIM